MCSTNSICIYTCITENECMNRYIYIQKVQLYEETCNSIEIYNKISSYNSNM